jgi:hypothetical protein
MKNSSKKETVRKGSFGNISTFPDLNANAPPVVTTALRDALKSFKRVGVVVRYNKS